MTKIKTLAEIIAHPLIDRVIEDYDGRGRHMVECKDGYRFESFSSTIEIGSIKELCDCINNWMEKQCPKCGSWELLKYDCSTCIK